MTDRIGTFAAATSVISPSFKVSSGLIRLKTVKTSRLGRCLLHLQISNRISSGKHGAAIDTTKLVVLIVETTTFRFEGVE